MTLQLVIPASGLGSRFSSQGYKLPKPLLPIGDKTMLERVLDNLSHPNLSKVVVIMNESQSSGLVEIFSKRIPKVTLVNIDYLTQGPASTSILAKPYLDPDLPLVIANSDQYLATNFSLEYNYLTNMKNDGVVWAMQDKDPKWSYVKVDSSMYATELKEKEVISPYATCGVYGFAKASSYFTSYQEMLQVNDRVNNEFYVAPSYNYLIKEGKKILVRNLGVTKDIMFGLGIPSDYEHFLKTKTCKDLISN